MMNLTEAQFDTIERYLGQLLSGDEQQRFEAELSRSPELRQEVDRQRTLREALQGLAAQERFRQMHARLKSQGLLTTESEPTEDENAPEVPVRPLRPEESSSEGAVRELRPLTPAAGPQLVRRSSPFVKYLVAATITGLTLGSAFYFLLRSPAEPAPETLYKSFYQPDSAASLLPPSLSWADAQGREINNPAYRQTLEEAVRAYRQGRYQQSERLIRGLPERGGSSVFFQDYYLGISYLETGDTPRALRYLTAASRAPQTPPRQQAEWYLALAYLKAEQPAPARRILEKIRQTAGHVYEAQARELLRKL